MKTMMHLPWYHPPRLSLLLQSVIHVFLFQSRIAQVKGFALFRYNIIINDDNMMRHDPSSSTPTLPLIVRDPSRQRRIQGMSRILQNEMKFLSSAAAFMRKTQLHYVNRNVEGKADSGDDDGSSLSSPPYSSMEPKITNHDRGRSDFPSGILYIKVQNLTAMVTCDEEPLVLEMMAPNEGKRNQLVAVTGETGHGKSLLVSKVIDLVTGGKAAASLLQSETREEKSKEQSESAAAREGAVEVVLQLGNPQQINVVRELLESLDLDSVTMLGPQDSNPNQPVTLSLKRILTLSSSQNSPNAQPRMKCTCFINQHAVTLKALRAIGEPLLTLVDASAAANALRSSNKNSNHNMIAVLDRAVVAMTGNANLITTTQELQKKYRECRKERQRLEQELQQHQTSLPRSSSHMNNDNIDDNTDLKLMQHWVDELDVFAERLNNVCRSIELRQELSDEDDEYEYENDNIDGIESRGGDSALTAILKEIGRLEWTSNSNDDSDSNFGSLLYMRLLDLSTHLKDLEDQMNLVRQAHESLSSLSSPTSAQSAIERTRQSLLQAMGASRSSSKATAAAEKAQGLLNELDNVLCECSRAIEDDSAGLMSILQEERNNCALVTSEELAEHLAEWNRLSRKHGISPYLLPSCHMSLRRELDGNFEALTMLPMVRQAEQEAMQAWQHSCQALSRARSHVAKNVSKMVSQRLPSLGMRHSAFHVNVRQPQRTLLPTSGLVGIDEAEFYLFHRQKATAVDSSSETVDSMIDDGNTDKEQGGLQGGKLDQVASSGERARILLAMECSTPGAIRALSSGTTMSSALSVSCPPVAVVYDEIDAHVGGRASVAVADMLMEQSQSCQVVSITHSPSVAATATRHIVVEKVEVLDSEDECLHISPQAKISAHVVNGSVRLDELARMASGDLATKEAKAFAEALILYSSRKGDRKPDLLP